MTEKEKKNALIKEVIRPLLKSAGFKGTGTTFYSEREKCYIVINIQSSQFNLEALGYSFWYNIKRFDKSEIKDLNDVKKYRGGGFGVIHESFFLPNHGYFHPYHKPAGYNIGGTKRYQPIITDYEDAKERLSNDLTQYILPRLQPVQKEEDWNTMVHKMNEETDVEKIKMISFFFDLVGSANSRSNVSGRIRNMNSANITKEDVVKNMDLLPKVLEYQDTYDLTVEEIKSFIAIVLDEYEKQKTCEKGENFFV
ncbi:DUF4304 domain-containing protein [Anaerosporobacter faecicola]|uniref:DUF4304 domain-containing protein n=1 Tax=Anaerosporobacter faecicola TaxID=2718714 RepID=UPI00143B2CCB|nr:DUF4304 domain-containing protein [Anaerosporobacter faecicola]